MSRIGVRAGASGSANMRIEVPAEEVAAFCRRHGVRKLALFGSVLRDDFTPDSDVDVLVEFEAGRTPGLAFFGTLPDELSAILGRRVDLNTAGCLSARFRRDVIAEAVVVHAAS